MIEECLSPTPNRGSGKHSSALIDPGRCPSRRPPDRIFALSLWNQSCHQGVIVRAPSGRMFPAMAGRDYFIRQATALLRLAKAVKDPALSAELITKAADLGEKALEAGD